MGNRIYRKPGAKPDETSSRLVKKRLNAANVPQAAIQRFAKGAATPEDLLILQQTLGNEAVTDLLAQNGKVPGLENASAPAGQPTVQRQDSMDEDEGEELSAIDPPEKEQEEESGGMWGGLKKAWGWLKEKMFGGDEADTDDRTTPETGSEPYEMPPYYEPPTEETGEWADEEFA
jgi:hypothetical protein